MTKLILGTLCAVGSLFLVAALAQSPHPTQQLTVYDGDGKRVGVVAGGGYYSVGFLPLVALKIGNVPFMLYVYRDGFGQGEIGWESTDCSGPPYVANLTTGPSFTPSSMPITGVGLPGSTVYVENGAPTTISLRSASGGPHRPGSSTAGCVSYPYTLTIGAVPARPLVDMNTLYKPPFTVR